MILSLLQYGFNNGNQTKILSNFSHCGKVASDSLSLNPLFFSVAYGIHICNSCDEQNLYVVSEFALEAKGGGFFFSARVATAMKPQERRRPRGHNKQHFCFGLLSGVVVIELSERSRENKRWMVQVLTQFFFQL